MDKTRTLEQADLWSSTVTPLARRGAWIPHTDGMGVDTRSRIEHMLALLEDTLRLAVAFGLARGHEHTFDDGTWHSWVDKILPDLVQPSVGKRIAIVATLEKVRERACGWQLGRKDVTDVADLARVVSKARREAARWQIYDERDPDFTRGERAGHGKDVPLERIGVLATLQLLSEVRNAVVHNYFPEHLRPDLGTAMASALEALIRENSLMCGTDYHLVAVTHYEKRSPSRAFARGVCLRGSGGLLLRGGDWFPLKSAKKTYEANYLWQLCKGDVLLVRRTGDTSTLIAPFALAPSHEHPPRATRLHVIDALKENTPSNVLSYSPGPPADPLEHVADGVNHLTDAEVDERCAALLPGWEKARARQRAAIDGA